MPPQARAGVASRAKALRRSRRDLVLRLRALADAGDGALCDAAGYDAAVEASMALRANMTAESRVSLHWVPT